ncbi:MULTISPECIES: LysR substrate-binding domain-containing protein [Brevibacterium]|uniref:LysR family transcriptional regulator n=2 Tax=Actinomycetes TaxID=1760 RepID=A0A7T4A1F5_9MICO|nr:MULTISPECIES: LysR substrate-binding domain-containing protein [Brevibacterium]QQB15558.1 LysR family transcriptional regulator [Brevibacterium casei]
MELRHLRYFLAVAEEKHFGRAADRLHMAQPPLSNQIKQLEAELGTTLFERTTRRVEVTEAGLLLMDRARQLLSDVEAAEFDVAEVGRGAAGVLRVGFSGTATYRLMPEVVRRAQTELPNVRLQISGEMLTPQMENALLENRIDIAVLRPPVQSGELILDEFEQTPIVAILPMNHPAICRSPQGHPVSVAELADTGLVSYPRSSTVASAVWELYRQLGFRPRIVQTATETSTLIAMVSAGLGVALIPDPSGLPLRTSIAVRPLAEQLTIGLAVARRAHGDHGSHAITPLQSAFANLTRAASAHLRDNA